MQIVIDILDKEYEEIIDNKLNKSWDMTHYERVIANGTLLPKGHGRLIDADNIINEFYERYPKNYMGGLELNGSSCVFSYNDVIEIINNIIKSRNTND